MSYIPFCRASQALSIAQNSTNKSINNTFLNELHLFASKWIQNPNECEAFIIAFQTEMKNTVHRLSLNDIEKLCTDRLNQTV
ncbi:unnamed protein product [Rotaria sordida]|uniref:Uncharacterized protein n=1 Tax=Rotaria sordida TaxID=392033 RepID=A0A815T486_9BILA|nr:unnamed protein product [Rotaria sordida]CAF4112954.1 unnamed protein product [Rotaria sordida]